MRIKLAQRCLLLLLSAVISHTHAETIIGKAIGVIDGDTIEILEQGNHLRRIRLSGIDAPEKGQSFGQRSKQGLSDLVFGKQVEAETSKIDRYGRAVAKVFINGKDVNLEQIKKGLAWHYKEYQKEQSLSDRRTYTDEEEKSKVQKIGLWIDPDPMPPWAWRHGGKNESTQESLASGCPCGSDNLCTGKRGGQYCISPSGKKRY